MFSSKLGNKLVFFAYETLFKLFLDLENLTLKLHIVFFYIFNSLYSILENP